MKQNSNWPQYLPTLLIQQIRLQWYKDCRGGNAAAQRNQYPKAMRLPKDFFSYYSFGLPTHFVSILQRPDGFQIDKDCRRLMEWKPNGTMRLHPFELIQQESGIQMRYRYDWHIGAMPERYTYDKTATRDALPKMYSSPTWCTRATLCRETPISTPPKDISRDAGHWLWTAP